MKGYDRIPGIDFTELVALTAKTTLRTMLIITLSYSDEDGWTIKVIDIETVFLEVELKEEVWIEVPDGYEFALDEIDWTQYVMLPLKAMYGLVEAQCAFYEMFWKILTSAEVRMVQSKVDLCLFYKQDGNRKLTAMMVIHVNDCAITGKKETIYEIKKSIAKWLSVKDEGRLSKPWCLI